MIPHRSSGILAHITSLPSPYGIGDIGPSSYNFLQFLKKGEQSYWQFLPTNPTNSHFDNSPYMANSAFAGNPLLISPELLYQVGCITKIDLQDRPEFSPYTTEFDKVVPFKKMLLEKAFKNFIKQPPLDFNTFVNNSAWLKDYALFMACKKVYNEQCWSEWPKKIATRDKAALSIFHDTHKPLIQFYYFEQYEFFRQWQLLKNQCQQSDIHLFGDLPIYVSYDSVDVWSHQKLFTLDPTTLRPSFVSGVPPDYFSSTGQRWGNPLYNWQSKDPLILNDLNDWWANRLAHLFSQVDVARIDHFRGFESYWSIAEESENAISGVWLKGPGLQFFKEMESRLGQMNIIAEDLGIITEEVVQLRETLEYPGMKVLQFAFDGNPENNFLPHNFDNPQCIVYTGTHDNDTTLGWFLGNKVSEDQRTEVKICANRTPHDSSPINRDLIYLAQSSISQLCVFPLQDVLGFGNDCKMNSPGVPTGNWRWRCGKEFLTSEIELYLADSTKRYRRDRKKCQD